jgi:hypothetical protein
MNGGEEKRKGKEGKRRWSEGGREGVKDESLKQDTLSMNGCLSM